MTTFEEERVNCYEDYLESFDHLKQTLQQEAKNLEKALQEKKVSAAYVNKMNRLFATINHHAKMTEVLLKELELHIAVFGNTPQQYALQESQRENRILKRYIHALGGDPSLAKWMQETDFF